MNSAKLLITLSLIGVTSCAISHTNPSEIQRGNYNVQQDTFCEQKVDAMCIDQHIETVRNNPEAKFNIAELERYCEKGNGSACLFLSKYKGRKFLKKACLLKEPRACHDKAEAWMSKPTNAPCGGETKSTAKVGKNSSEKQIYVRLEKEEISNKVRKAYSAIVYCYDRKLSGLPPKLTELFEGRVDMQFEVSPRTGKVTSSIHTCSDFHDNEFLKCLDQVGRTLKFDYPDKEGLRVPTVINYPFIFKPASQN